MEWKDLEQANKELDTIPLQGKQYVMVNKRVLAFRKLCPMGSISTDILSMQDGVVVMKCTITDEHGSVLGTGMAYEKESSSYINKTSFIENCETSAVGRALAMVGIGVDASMCSAEELVNAINNQNKGKGKAKDEPSQSKAEQPSQDVEVAKIDQTKIRSLIAKASEANVSQDELLRVAKVPTFTDITLDLYMSLMKKLDVTIKANSTKA